MDQFIFFYVGTNSVRGSKGIYTLTVDNHTGEMKIITTTESENSAFMCLSRDKKHLYSVIESLQYEGKPGGGVASYNIVNHIPIFNNKQYAWGGWPCHINFDRDEDYIMVSVFRNGTWLLYPVTQDGSIHSCIFKKQHSEPNGRPSRIHASIPSPDNRYALVADCGLDCVYVYCLQDGGLEYTLELPSDCGPRQMVFGPEQKYLYLLSETSCELFTILYDPLSADKLKLLDTKSIMRKDGYEGPNYGGGLHMDPTCKYLLATNRGHNSIAVFSIDREKGIPSLVSHKMLAGDHCREFAFTPDGRMIIAGLQHTDIVQSFWFNERTGAITDTGYYLNIPSPSSIII